MMTGGEEKWGGGCCRRLQELGKNIKIEIELRSTQEVEGEACTGGGRLVQEVVS
jgi:hypothetical protein